MEQSASVRFFDQQFRRQAAAGEFGLNPFEARALPYLSGGVLDLGCGLGNLAVAAAGQGARVLALDASPAAIESLAARARAGNLPIDARVADLSEYLPEGEFDAVVAIGLFMFFPCPAARRQLLRALSAVRSGGIAVINVLIEGTTYMGMFDEASGYCLFAEDELPRALAGWQRLDDRVEEFPAPGGIKRFRTTIARRNGKQTPHGKASVAS
jgi:tellurite methyltransferase